MKAVRWEACPWPTDPPREAAEAAEGRRQERVPPAVEDHEDQPAEAQIDPICRPTTIEAIYAGTRRTG